MFESIVMSTIRRGDWFLTSRSRLLEAMAFPKDPGGAVVSTT